MDFFGENLNALNEIRVICQAYIDFERSIGSIRIRSNNPTCVQRAISSIRVTIRDIKAQTASSSPLYIVEPPTLCQGSKVTFGFSPAENGGSEPMLTSMTFNPSCPTEQEATMWNIRKAEYHEENRQRYLNHFKKAIDELQALKSWMRMRVHFGQVQLLQYHKISKDSAYTYGQLVEMMRQPRTMGKFEKE